MTPRILERLAALSPEKRALVAARLGHTRVSGHQLIALTLRDIGVTHVYSVSGTPIEQTLGACVKAGIRAIGTRHQQAATLMAQAQNYAGGRIRGVVILSAGPAITNAATGILVAWDNAWPLIVLGGRRPRSMDGKGCFQELDAVPIFRSITKWSDVVTSTADIPRALTHAFRTASSGRPGPVYLDLPEDLLNGEEAYAPDQTPSDQWDTGLEADACGLRKAAEILRNAKRPAMIIGKGVRWSEPYSELRQLAEDYGIPFITSPMGRGYLPDDHPLCFNRASRCLQGEADALLVVGTRLNWTFRFGAEIDPNAQLIHVDVDKGELGRNINPAVAIRADAKAALSQLLAEMQADRLARPGVMKDEGWLSRLADVRTAATQAIESSARDDRIPMSPQRLMKEIRDHLPRDAICIFDGNISMAAGQRLIPSFLPASRFTAGSNGCIGSGIPFGLGAKLAEPERPVIVISGDTGFGFNAMELETAVRYQIRLAVVVVDNEGISGALKQEALYPGYPERVTQFSAAIPYEQIAAALGCQAESVSLIEQVGPALRRAFSAGIPACINVRVDPHAPYPK